MILQPIDKAFREVVKNMGYVELPCKPTIASRKKAILKTLVLANGMGIYSWFLKFISPMLRKHNRVWKEFETNAFQIRKADLHRGGLAGYGAFPGPADRKSVV